MILKYLRRDDRDKLKLHRKTNSQNASNGLNGMRRRCKHELPKTEIQQCYVSKCNSFNV